MFNSKIFGERLKELRQGKQVTQETVAKLLGVTKTQISDMEKSRSHTTFENLYLLCEYFDVSADYLLGLSDEPTPLK